MITILAISDFLYPVHCYKKSSHKRERGRRGVHLSYTYISIVTTGGQDQHL